MSTTSDAPAASPESKHNGFDAPNFTPVPNKFFDELMPQITDMSEMKVALALFRLTFGWQREQALLRLKLKDLAPHAQLKRPAIHRGLTSAIKRGYVQRVRIGTETERGKPSYAYGLRVGKDSSEVVVYDIRDFKKFNKTGDAPKTRGTVQQDAQTGARLFIIKNSSVHQDEQSAGVSYIEKESKHTPKPPSGKNRVFKRVRAEKKTGKQGSQPDSSAPACDLPLCELFPSVAVFLTAERRAAFATLAPGFDAEEVAGSWLKRYADDKLSAGDVEKRWKRYAENWFDNRKGQPRYAAAIKAAQAAQAEAAMPAEEKEQRVAQGRAQSILQSISHYASSNAAMLAEELEKYRRLYKTHPAIKGQLVEAYERLRRTQFYLKLPALDPATHPDELPMQEWDCEAVGRYSAALFHRLNRPENPRMRRDLTEAERLHREEMMSEYEAIRRTFPELNLPPLAVPTASSAAAVQSAKAAA